MSRSNHTLYTYNSTAKLLEYQQIQEAIEMNLTKSEAHLKFVLCAPRLDALFSFNPATISTQVSWNKLLVKVRPYYLFSTHNFSALLLQVSRGDMKTYTKKVFNDLIQPLKAAISDTFRGPTTIATVLLAETLLALLPTMSTQNITYDVLKEYQLVPLQSGSMQHNRRICLAPLLMHEQVL